MKTQYTVVRIIVFAFFAVCLLGTCKICAKPPYHHYKNRGSSTTSQRNSGNYSSSDYSGDVAGAYSDLQNEVENHEIELRMFEERLNTQETILDTMRQQFIDSNLANQQMLKGNTVSIEKQVSSMDSNVNGMVKDLRDLQFHANDTAKAFSQYKQKIADLEKQVGHMQNAVDSILLALQIDDPKAKDIQNQVYEVQSGDILDKIAQKHKTSVKKIKELNGLKNDRIYVGQKLKIP